MRSRWDQAGSRYSEVSVPCVPKRSGTIPRLKSIKRHTLEIATSCYLISDFQESSRVWDRLIPLTILFHTLEQLGTTIEFVALVRFGFSFRFCAWLLKHAVRVC